MLDAAALPSTGLETVEVRRAENNNPLADRSNSPEEEAEWCKLACAFEVGRIRHQVGGAAAGRKTDSWTARTAAGNGTGPTAVVATFDEVAHHTRKLGFAKGEADKGDPTGETLGSRRQASFLDIRIPASSADRQRLVSFQESTKV